MGTGQSSGQDSQSASGGRPIARRRASDRRDGERAGSTGLERRRGPGRRLSDSLRAAEEGEMTKEQFLFLVAIDAFKQANQVHFPTWTDVLEVVRLLGYRKTMTSEVNLPRAEDWREPANAPANVRPDKFDKRVAKELGIPSEAEFESIEDEEDRRKAA